MRTVSARFLDKGSHAMMKWPAYGVSMSNSARNVTFKKSARHLLADAPMSSK
jgi:hypothetical protein